VISDHNLSKILESILWSLHHSASTRIEPESTPASQVISSCVSKDVKVKKLYPGQHHKREQKGLFGGIRNTIHV
jgi:hypothetical protein